MMSDKKSNAHGPTDFVLHLFSVGYVEHLWVSVSG